MCNCALSFIDSVKHYTLYQRKLRGNMETKKLEKYLIKKDSKTDVLSSLEKVDKKIINNKLK